MQAFAGSDDSIYLILYRIVTGGTQVCAFTAAIIVFGDVNEDPATFDVGAYVSYRIVSYRIVSCACRPVWLDFHATTSMAELTVCAAVYLYVYTSVGLWCCLCVVAATHCRE